MLLIDLLESASLPMDDASRMKRAKKLGFTKRAYHGTTASFNEFDMSKGKGNHFGFAPFFADVKAEASGYGGKVLEVFLRIRKPLIVPNTWATMPEDVPKIDVELYSLITGGAKPGIQPNKYGDMRERYSHAHDAIEHAMDIHYHEEGNYDRRAIWTKIYKRLISAGYDAIIWKDTPADYSGSKYDKINMLDMSGIRLRSAEFDPAKADSKDIRA